MARHSTEEMAVRAREASRQLQAAPTEIRERILLSIADALEAKSADILAENELDIAASQGKISDALLNRLILKEDKIKRLAEGIRSIAKQDEPIRKLLRKMKIADGLDLEQVASPIGVLLIIFEARPDALP